MDSTIGIITQWCMGIATLLFCLLFLGGDSALFEQKNGFNPSRPGSELSTIGSIIFIVAISSFIVTVVSFVVGLFVYGVS